jgi:hypothetical protein
MDYRFVMHNAAIVASGLWRTITAAAIVKPTNMSFCDDPPTVAKGDLQEVQ